MRHLGDVRADFRFRGRLRTCRLELNRQLPSRTATAVQHLWRWNIYDDAECKDTKLFRERRGERFDCRPAVRYVPRFPSKALVAEMVEGAALGRRFLVYADRGWYYRTFDWAGACEMFLFNRKCPSSSALCRAGAPSRITPRRGASSAGSRSSSFGAETGREGCSRRSSGSWGATSSGTTGRHKAFREDGRIVYAAIDGRRARLSLAAQPVCRKKDRTPRRSFKPACGFFILTGETHAEKPSIAETAFPSHVSLARSA